MHATQCLIILQRSTVDGGMCGRGITDMGCAPHRNFSNFSLQWCILCIFTHRMSMSYKSVKKVAADSATSSVMLKLRTFICMYMYV